MAERQSQDGAALDPEIAKHAAGVGIPGSSVCTRGPLSEAESQQRARRHSVDGHSIHFDTTIEPAHVGFGEESTQLTERRYACGYVPCEGPADQRCRFVRWKEAE